MTKQTEPFPCPILSFGNCHTHCEVFADSKPIGNILRQSQGFVLDKSLCEYFQIKNETMLNLAEMKLFLEDILPRVHNDKIMLMLRKMTAKQAAAGKPIYASRFGPQERFEYC